ncbi:MAG: 30S ribosomal protein S1 [Ignavibacteria bacterium]|nr:30S ribosomal protein S1 [Ignavibacteria bacterium]
MSVLDIAEGNVDLPFMDDSSFASLYEKTLTNIKQDELIRGKVVSMTKDSIFVDIGFKSLGVVPRAEFISASVLEIGEEIDVFVETIEDSTGKLVLSRRRADFMKTWDDIMNLHNTQAIVPVRILRRIKGGMVVDLLGIEAFLPGSQIDMRPVRDFDAWVTKVIDVRVVKINHPNENVVVSHKVLLEEQIAEQRGKILDTLEKGLILEGTVKTISDFGIFVDLGGVDGLVHITDLSWGRVSHPSEIVSLDNVVKVVVLDFDSDKRRISLGMKQLTSHPWETIGEKYEPKARVHGKVVSLTDYGAFIEIEKGVEGLIHISEMSWTQHIKHPSQVVSMGQIVEAMVLSIDKNDKKLALGMKQLDPDPWQDLLVKYPVNSVHDGIVRNLTNFGLFVELEPGVDGLVHISDLSWTKKIRHPGEFTKKGDNLKVIVLSIDADNRRIALGHKQITDNPWEFFATRFQVSAETEGKIERIIEKGVIVELPEGVDGFVPVSQLSFAPVRNIAEFFHVGDLLPLRVVEFDKESKKIVLSAVEALREKGQEVIEAYNAVHPVPNSVKYSGQRQDVGSMPIEAAFSIENDNAPSALANAFAAANEASEAASEATSEVNVAAPVAAEITTEVAEAPVAEAASTDVPVDVAEVADAEVAEVAGAESTANDEETPVTEAE